MNGRDFTNDKVTYGFYDAYVLDVQPKLISKKGGTLLSVKGFGFVDSGASETYSKFSSKLSGELHCSEQSPCTQSAQFVDKNTMTTVSLP